MKIAINGFGRIGRSVYKIIKNYDKLEVAAINDLTDRTTLEHLLKYDSVYGKYEGSLCDVQLIAEPDPEKLPWEKMEIDAVVESTGRFTDLESSQKHIKAGVKLVIISAPCKSEGTPHFVYGVNHEKYNNEKVISAGSCTTVALAHMLKAINDNFEIEKGLMTTIHSYTNDQQLLDLPHKDLRRARATALSFLPTTTGAAKTISKIIPELKGKLDGIAVRVPTPVVSLIDLTCLVKNKTNKDEVNNVFKENKTDESLVSIDFKGDPRPVILDAKMTRVQDDLVKVLGWYDNEYGYSVQLVKLLEYIVK